LAPRKGVDCFAALAMTGKHLVSPAAFSVDADMSRTRDFQCGVGVERDGECAYLFDRQQWNEGLT
jgi:hypothetical protein